MNPLSPPPLVNHRRLGVVALFIVAGLVGVVAGLVAGLVGVVTPLLAETTVQPAPDAKTQPVYLAYTTNNNGYLFTCG